MCWLYMILGILALTWCRVTVGHWDQYDTFVYPRKEVLNMTEASAFCYPLNDPDRCSLDVINETSLLSYLLKHKRDIGACEVTDLFHTVNAVKKILIQLSKQIYCSFITFREYIVHASIAAPQLREVPKTV